MNNISEDSEIIICKKAIDTFGQAIQKVVAQWRNALNSYKLLVKI